MFLGTHILNYHSYVIKHVYDQLHAGAVEAPQKWGGEAQSKKGTDEKVHIPFKKRAH